MGIPWNDMKPEQQQRHLADVLARQAAKRDMIRAFKAERGCAVCGEDDPVVLDLHHRDPQEKSPQMRAGGAGTGAPWLVRLGWDAIRSELQKCDVLCANCHRRHHAEARRVVRVVQESLPTQPTLWD